MSLITYTTPFTGGPSFYTGISGASDLVPHIFPVAIDGRPYMLDTASGRYARTFEARLRDSVDQSDIPGEAAINPQGLWRRGQTSWHFGFNQKYGDLPDSSVERFEASLGVDVWTEGELTLLNDVKVSSSTAGTNLFLAVVGDELWHTDGSNVKYTTDPYATSPTWTTISGTGTIRDIQSIGADAYVVFAGTGTTQGIVKVDGGTHTLAGTATAHGVEFDKVGYAKGRLVASSTTSSKLWFDPSGNNPTADYTHPDGDFRWVGFASGQNAIYCAGYSGQKSLIYKVTIQADGTLDTPVVAAELPFGERVYSLAGYLGYILIGTNEGSRYASADADANLVLGQTIAGTNPILCADGYQQYVWVGVTDYTGDYTGLGRIDLSHYVDVNVPASAPDLMYEGQGDVQSVATFDSKRVFTVSGVGVVVEDTANLMASGYCETGTWRWGIPDPKFLAFFDLEYEELNGSIDVDYAYDGVNYQRLGTANLQGGTLTTLTGPDTQYRQAKFKVTLNRDSVTPSEGPVLARWQARAVPSPSRSELFQVPVLLHQRINRFNREYNVDVQFELDKLRDLIHNPRVIQYQTGTSVYRTIVESVEWVPVDQPNDDYIFDGTATVTLRSLVE
jgi:hypothetical protein